MNKKLRNLNPVPTLFYSIFIFLLTTILGSCKKDTTSDINETRDTFPKIFAQFWDKMNSKYVYWDRETTDWNSVYKQYKPLFDQLSNSDEDKRKAMSYFTQMTSNLIDHHLSITFLEQPLNGSVINPSLARKVKAQGYHGRYNYDYMVKPYLDNGFVSGRGNISNNGELISATSGTINNNILYFHCNFFALKQSYNSTGDNTIKQILNYFFSNLKKTGNPIKGIILDLRNNNGGNIEDLNFLAGKLVPQDHIFGYSRSKTGMGKLDYLPWLESSLKHDPDYSGTVPIMLLGDNFSASLSEIMIIALKSKANLFIGEQTYGATGPLSDPDIFNAGSFNIGTFLSVKTSSVEFKGIDGTFYEGIGITPDISSPFNLQALSAGKDLQLETAINQINKNEH
ncbi:S41 family peptidase [Pedobacter sp. HMWF019]|uniref:S41 family peptidase n=1 Tax=Pedobacter sp. HMWF019 TaxID=2056856 RepID=UPI00130499A4|nr:S41 family peptidase [Pedobacter sp. HMWF019]